ncbi:MAG: hypothetical protein DRI57_04240 [Deltaproteobacteria bacterium]|nr:MAG: hypothetical protein DRI57_04240 [Deltaproteobacteria bacterium]
MNYIQFKKSLAGFPIFSIPDIKAVDERFDRRRLTEWQHKGYIRKIIKGHYLFSDYDLDENGLFRIANKIYKPSYISFETALAYYHLIPESVYAVTSATTRRTYKFETPVAGYAYRTILRRLFFGYFISGHTRIATMEKAILDYFYVNTSLKTEDDFASLRINEDAFFERFDEKRFINYMERFNQKILTSRMKHFLRWLDND